MSVRAAIVSLVSSAFTLAIPTGLLTGALVASLAASPALAQAKAADAPDAEPRLLITNARIFDGKADTLTQPSNVLIVGNTISSISTTTITPDGATVIDAAGRTLMPGLIDAHVHLTVGMLSPADIMRADAIYIGAVSTRFAEEILMRGFTSVRDMGGPAHGIKRAIDSGYVKGPRVWPCGAFISQSGGHGDFRSPQDMPAPPGFASYLERIGGTVIADDPDAVRRGVREQLALGASQIKMMAGGGVASSYDPLDVTQYTVEELRAGVEAAENWGTYVAVHAYTPRAVRQALEAGVKCIDHGQLLDDETAKMMADKDAWWSLQAFLKTNPSAFPEGSPNRLKQLEMCDGTDKAFALAKKYGIKTAWGSDAVTNPVAARRQNTDLFNMTTWYTPAEVLRIATSSNAELLALSGKRSPYQGKLGVVEAGALADLLIVDGDPIADLKLITDPAKNFKVIIKDGEVVKNTLGS